jgi:predicted nucleic acid-binding protein
LIYLDTSVALAHLVSESPSPPAALWRERLVSSRILEYEFWNRIHARGLTRSHGDEARVLLVYISLIDLAPPVLARALEPFPTPVGTLDGLHLATIKFLRAQGEKVELASYDRRLNAGARALGVSIYAL